VVQTRTDSVVIACEGGAAVPSNRGSLHAAPPQFSNAQARLVHFG
jgi:hypothetical protein